jgi:hypothetical protein
MKRNGNWDDVSLKSTMESGNLLQDPNYKPNLGVPITSLWSHLYSITQS